MVAVAIIALLVGILLPAFQSARMQAAALETRSLLAALETGNEAFRAERAIGGSYVPSGTDAEVTDGAFGDMRNPFNEAGEMIGPISGASLLVYGLAGADRLGTPGFPDIDGDGAWYNDQGNNDGTPPGAYFLDQTSFEPVHPRYGPYLGDNALAQIRGIGELVLDGVIIDEAFPGPELLVQTVFVDAWEQPILYYRARRAAIFMITNPTTDVPGIYDHRDNEYFTGSAGRGVEGIDMGGVMGGQGRPGGGSGGAGHNDGIGQTLYPLPTADLADPDFSGTFEHFIWDINVGQRPTPVHRETFLLISAGPDALYGTHDDVTNWTRP